MASNDDTDDLYADLYGEAGAGSGDVVDFGAKGNDDSDLIGYEDQSETANGNADGANVKPSGGSFIPAATAPTATDRSGTQNRGSFIPSVAGNTAGNDYREGAGNNGQQQFQQGIQTHHTEPSMQSDDRGNRGMMPHEMPEEGKMFIGGLNWDTTEDSLRQYFAQFGEVIHCTIMRDSMTGRSRGFAFLNYADPKSVNTVVVREHYLDGKNIDPKRAIPKSQQQPKDLGSGVGQPARNQKLFVGGLPSTITAESFRSFFEQYGTLLECTCMMDRETGKPRGFGFLTFQEDTAIDTLMANRPLMIEGKEIDIKRAQSKNDPQSLQMRRQMQRENPDMAMGMGLMGNSSGPNSQFGGGNLNPWGGMMNPMMMGMMGGAGQQGGGGFDPNAMAQMYRNMGWGGQNWNPMAWQQMMANMAGGGGGTGTNASGMDMSAMMGMGGMGMMGMGGSMSPPISMGMSPSMGSGRSQRDSSSGPAAGGDDSKEGETRSSSGAPPSSRFQRGAAGLPSKPRSDEPREISRDYRDRERERSPRPSSGRGDDRSSYRRERSPDRRDDRYESYNSGGGSRNRY